MRPVRERVDVPVRRARAASRSSPGSRRAGGRAACRPRGPPGSASASGRVSTLLGHVRVRPGSPATTPDAWLADPCVTAVDPAGPSPGRASAAAGRARRNGVSISAGTVQGRRAGQQRQREQQRAGVGVADEPRRLGGPGDRVEVEQRQQVDGQLTAPRRDDRADARIGEHRDQLGGALGRRRARRPGAVHALARPRPRTRDRRRSATQKSSRGRRSSGTPDDGDVTPMTSPGRSGAG